MPTAVAAIVLGAGRGERLGHALPKAFVPVAGAPVIARAIERIGAARGVSHIVAVVPAADVARFEAIADAARRAEPPADAASRAATRAASRTVWSRVAPAVPGGAERQDSVACGLAALPDGVELVAVHDAARCLVDPEDVERAIEAARATGAALLAARATDTIKLVDGVVVVRTPPRATCFAAQTPQVFRADVLREAHAKARADGFLGTDDAELVERLGVAVRVVEARAPNPKLTHAADLAVAEQWLARGDAARAPEGAR